jgi:16S rRNA (adenine1518-N6/adenine1519-N6)-dimethyltransferase
MHTAELRVLLEEMGKQPNKRLGQNFLIDLSVVHAALEAGQVKKGDLILEVGPGLGVLTEALLEAKADVIAIEKDRAFAERLQSLHPESSSHLHVIEGDAAQIDWMKEIEENSKQKIENRIQNIGWKFIANIPYSISSLLLRKALWNSNPPLISIILIQKEVAERGLVFLRPAPSAQRPSLLSLMIGLSCSSGRIIRKVPPRCFFPPPKVDSVVLELIPLSVEDRMKKWGIDPEEVMKVAKVAFAHPRKQMASNLSGVNDLSKQDIEKILETLNLNPKIRSEELTIQDWVDLASSFPKSTPRPLL